MNLPNVGNIWFVEVDDKRLTEFDAIIGLDSGLDGICLKDKIMKIRGKNFVYQMSDSSDDRESNEAVKIQREVEKVLTDYQNVFMSDEFSSVSDLDPVELRLKENSTPIKLKPMPLSVEDMKIV